MASKDLDRLLLLKVPELRDIFIEEMENVMGRALVNDLVTAIENNDLERAIRAVGFTPAAIDNVILKIEEIYRESGVITADTFPTRIDTGNGGVIFRFNMRNRAVEEALRNNSSRLIAQITEDAREIVRMNLELNMIEGRNPRSVARDIVGRIDPRTKKRKGGAIGLSAGQERWVQNTRRKLIQLDERYFDLKLRDKRFDKVVRKAITEGKPLSQDKVSQITTSYRNRALQYRGELIGRTETTRAIQQGEFRAHQQVIDDGILERGAVTRWWDAFADERTRDTHRQIELDTRKNPIALDEAFVSPSGARMMHPGDTDLDAPVSEVAHCRCKVQYNIDWTRTVD